MWSQPPRPTLRLHQEVAKHIAVRDYRAIHRVLVYHDHNNNKEKGRSVVRPFGYLKGFYWLK
jgi:hypothetical protein